MAGRGRVITFGTFDLLHIGHVRLLQRARRLGASLVVGVSTDQLSFEKKGRFPKHSLQDRIEILESLACVDQVFEEVSLDAKRQYIQSFDADCLVMGDDWQGHFDDMPCKVVYLPRTPGISTTALVTGMGAPNA